MFIIDFVNGRKYRNFLKELKFCLFNYQIFLDFFNDFKSNFNFT